MAATVANLTLIANAIRPMGALVSTFIVATLFLPLMFLLGGRDNLERSLSVA